MWLRFTLIVSVLLLFGYPTEGAAQDRDPPHVPVTVTLMAANNAVTAIEFPDLLPGRIFERPAEGRIQYFVGLLSADEDGRFRTRVTYYTHKGEHTKKAVFQSEATCIEPEGATEGSIDRIACSVVEDGAGVVCSATYDMMEDPPRDYCIGTYACVNCRGVKVCGANPSCES
jgi:hypothetical protein